MKLIEKSAYTGIAELDGVKREINLTLVPEAKVGAYVIIHAGCAIEVLDETEAEKTIALFRDLAEKLDSEQ